MIRVMRLLEYQFDDYEQAEENMRHWAVPPFGSKQFGKRVIYSAMLPPMIELMREKDESIDE